MTNKRKLVQFDWDFLSTLDNEKNEYELTEREAAALRNVITQMQWSTRWNPDAPRAEYMDFVDQLAHKLLAPIGAIETDESCIEYPALSGRIDYHPAAPDVVPANYASPAFHVAQDTIPPQINEIVRRYGGDLQGIIGFEAGDIYTTVFDVPRPVYTGLDPFGWLSQWVNHIRSVITNGLPRISIELTGTGIIELHLLKIPVGGAVAVGVDVGTDVVDLVLDLIIGSVGASAFNAVIDLERDIIQAPPETGGEQIHEITINEAGSHIVDIVFVPTFDDELPVFKFGGGLRRIVSCGFDTPAPIEMGANLPVQFRLDGCTLQYQLENTDGTIYQAWTDVQGWDVNASACFTGPTGPAGSDGVSQTIIITDNGFGVDNDGDGIPEQTIDFSGSEPNELPPPSSITDIDKLCSAATYIADKIIALVDDTVTDAASITLSEFLAATLGLGGFKSSLLNQFWDYVVANLSGLQTEGVSGYRDELIESLYSSDLDKTATVAALSGVPQPQQGALVGAINSVTDGKWALWATVGAEAGIGSCASDVLITFDTPYPTEILSLSQAWAGGRSLTIAGDIQSSADGNPAPSWEAPQGYMNDNSGNPNRYGISGVLTVELQNEIQLGNMSWDWKFWQNINKNMPQYVTIYDDAGVITYDQEVIGSGPKEVWNNFINFFDVRAKKIEIRAEVKYQDSSWDATTGIYYYMDNLSLTGDF